MVSYNYFCILVNFHLLYNLLCVHKIGFTTDNFYLILNLALAISINCGTGLIPFTCKNTYQFNAVVSWIDNYAYLMAF